MRHMGARMLLVLCMVTFLAPAGALANLAEQEPQATPLTVVRNGEDKGAIIWWSRGTASAATQFAASELRSYLRQISGATVPVLEGSVTASAPLTGIEGALVILSGATAATYLGEGDAAQRETLLTGWLESVMPKMTGLRADGYVITPPTDTTGEVLVLAGTNDRAALYAAYNVLERVGVRFYAPRFGFYGEHAERVPTTLTVAIPADASSQNPSLRYRRKYVEEGVSHTLETLPQLIDWMAKNRLNVLVYPDNHGSNGYTKWDHWRQVLAPELERRGLLLEVGGHGYNTYLPPHRYQAEHPEWFASPTEPVANGVPPANVFHVANEQALQTYVDNVITYLKARPEIDIFDAWPPDNARWPQSDVDTLGSIPNANAHVTRRLTAALKQALPQVEVETVAYGPSVAPPNAAYMYSAENIINFAPFNRSYAEPISGPTYERNRYYVDLIKDWRERFGGNIGVYEYYRKYSWHSLPVVLPSIIGADIPYYDSIGVNGLGMYSEPGDWITYELTHRLVAALSWDTSIDARAWVARHLQERYGAAASEMATYLDLVEAAGGDLFNRAYGDYGDLQAVSDARSKYLQAAEVLATGRTQVSAGSTSDYLLERLGWNVQFAIADTEINYYNLQGESEQMALARQRTMELVERHRFNGILVKNLWTLRRYDLTVGLNWADKAHLFEMYRTGDGLPPNGSVSINGGAEYSTSAQVTVSVPGTDAQTSVNRVRLSADSLVAAYTLKTGVTLPHSPAVGWDFADLALNSSTADGVRTLWVQWRDRAGNWSAPQKDTIVLDRVAPTSRAPVAAFVRGSQVNGSVIPASTSVSLSWSASDAISGVARYELQQSTNGGAYTNVLLPAATSTRTTLALREGLTYRFRVRAQDRAGNWSSYAAGPAFLVAAYQDSGGAIAYSGTWAISRYSQFYGGTVRYARVSGPRARFVFTGRNVSWITTTGTNRGKAEVWLDGVRVATVDLYSSSLRTRRLMYTRSWTTRSTHTLEIRPLGTRNSSASNSYVDVDAFIVLR